MPEDIRIESLDQRKVCQRRKRYCEHLPQQLGAIPGEWRELLTRWVRRGGNSRWETLRNDAGVTGIQMAQSLLDWLLQEGWAVVVEQRQLGDWWPLSLELRNLSQLRSALGISDKEQELQRWHAAREELKSCCNENLASALLALDDLPVHRALARYDLIAALQRWENMQKSGTRRDFALAARDDTKGVSGAEWNWLEQTLDLAEFRIERHTPLLLLSASLTLTLPHGQLDLSCYSDFAAITPATLQNISAASGSIRRWQLVENRTSFERVARQRENDIGVIWLPGFPPSWWCTSVGHLLDLVPAPAQFACDPDPAGIAIALKAAELWKERNLTWQPWKMSGTDLAGLHVRKRLSDADRIQIKTLQQESMLPPPFLELIEWMLEHGEKGEQEGYL
ncbi:hypothetical protein [Sideroxydans sp. CL21]|uniref:hypothetical protein n=1 Tax=Sideroxydans sp. CL21 TaxID=2600596 RepID=UPI0024BC2464|nr:hypothetical protein [Sideroxydans sp. CL21]